MNEPSTERLLPIRTLVDVMTVRRQGLNMATALGFPLPEATKVAVVISELARNIINYAGGGSISLTAYTEGEKGIKILAQDRGPGIENLEAVLAGGYTTSKGMGVGLSGSRRMMDEFDVQTEVGKGTVVTATKWLRPRALRIGIRSR
jgi:serine/threonine-protein kinase RsbT